MECSLHANTRFYFYEKIRDGHDTTDSILLRRFDAKTATRDKFVESVRLTRFHDLYRDVYGRYVLYAISQSRRKNDVEPLSFYGDAFTSSNAKRQWQARDGERLMTVTLKELEARPRTSMRPPPRDHPLM